MGGGDLGMIYREFHITREFVIAYQLIAFLFLISYSNQVLDLATMTMIFLVI